jgi:DNA-binding MarR family transcriptional regulator
MTSCYCISLRTAARKTSAIYDDALEPFGINIAQYSLLKRINAAGQLSLTELARLCDLDRSTIGRNAKVLERMDLVAQVAGEDHREAMLELTVAGRQRLHESEPAWREAQDRIEALLGGAAGAGQLRSLLGALHQRG